MCTSSWATTLNSQYQRRQPCESSIAALVDLAMLAFIWARKTVSSFSKHYRRDVSYTSTLRIDIGPCYRTQDIPDYVYAMNSHNEVPLSTSSHTTHKDAYEIAMLHRAKNQGPSSQARNVMQDRGIFFTLPNQATLQDFSFW